MKKNNIFLILFMMLVTVSCQTIKNAVTGVKKENSDEFLVQKKHPLVLPPDFTDLPEPFEASLQTSEMQVDDDIEKLFGMEEIKSTDNTSVSSSIDSFVLKKFKEN